MFLNYSNKTINMTISNKLEFYLYLIQSFSSIIEILLILIVFYSRKKLEKSEICILTSFAVILATGKIFELSKHFIEKSGLKSKDNYSCITYFSLSSISTEFYLVLWYYSLFHLSMVRRSKIFQKIFSITRTIRNFFIFLFFTFTIIYSTNWLLYYWGQYGQFYFIETNSLCKKKGLNEQGKINLSTYIDLEYFIPSVFIFFNYLISITLLMNKNYQLNINKQKKDKLLRLSIKFLIFSLFSLFQTFRFLFIILEIIFNNNIHFFFIFFFVCKVLVFSFYSLIVIFIHQILKNTFYDLILSIISKKRKWIFFIRC